MERQMEVRGPERTEIGPLIEMDQPQVRYQNLYLCHWPVRQAFGITEIDSSSSSPVLQKVL